MSNSMPERTIHTLVSTGVSAISADTGMIDDILEHISAAELAKVKAYWADHAPSVIIGYPRQEQVFPVLAIVLTGDTINRDYIGVGEHDLAILDAELLDDGDPTSGNMAHRRLQGRFTTFIYAEHPDVCLWLYRIARAILNVGIPYLIANDLNDPTLDGAELAPDPRYNPENLSVRRLTLTVEYEEAWLTEGDLWVAINGAAEERLTSEGTVNIFHEDTTVDGVEGGVSPISSDELD